MLSHVDALGHRAAPEDLREVAVHSDLALGNIIVSGDRIVVLDFAMAKRGTRLHDLTRLAVQLDLLSVKPQFGSRVIRRLQLAVLEGFDPALRMDRPMFRLLTLLHRVNHLTTLSVNRFSPAEAVYNALVRRRHRRWIAAELAGGIDGPELPVSGRAGGVSLPPLQTARHVGGRSGEPRPLSPAHGRRAPAASPGRACQCRSPGAGRGAAPARQRLAAAAPRRAAVNGREISAGRARTDGDDAAVRRAVRAATRGHAAATPRWRASIGSSSSAGNSSTGRDIDWQADPVSGRHWPPVYHADVPVHGGDVGYGDVKHVWELSRQQYLIDLGKAHYLTGSDDDLDAIRRLVRSWVAGIPYATGVNWSCALEPAFRAWSWLWAYHLTAGALDDDFHVEWLQALHDHGRFLARHLEYYSSPYNHLIGEASALYALGVCFPEFADAAGWRRQGRSVLESRLDTQFYADGGSVEQSTFYHHATAGFYLLSMLLGRENGEEFSPRGRGRRRARDRVQHAARAARREDAGHRGRGRREADTDGASAVLGFPALPGDWRRHVRPARFQDGGRPLP